MGSMSFAVEIAGKIVCCWPVVLTGLILVQGPEPALVWDCSYFLQVLPGDTVSIDETGLWCYQS